MYSSVAERQWFSQLNELFMILWRNNMTPKDYIHAAELIKIECRLYAPDLKREIVNMFVKFFEADNYRFKPETFVEECFKK
jgi:hypothetical protein